MADDEFGWWLMMNSGRHERDAMERGFTLIEVMVALVVLSIGLLGIAAMQLQGLKNAHSAYQRTIASIIAMDAAERLWLELADGEVTDAVVDAVELDWVNAWDTDRSPIIAGNNVIGLPIVVSGVTKTRIEKSGDQYTIWVFWEEGRFEDAGADNESSFSYVMNLLP